MLTNFDRIVSSDDFDDFVIEFTRSFLIDFYGTSDYFCIAAIAKDAIFDIIERAKLFFQDIEESPDLVSFILKSGTDHFEDKYGFDETDWFDFINTRLGLFVVDLFNVTRMPIKYACKLNKGEYPNGDLISVKMAKFNEKYNLEILRYLYDHASSAHVEYDV
jgi:hypothetical protein